MLFAGTVISLAMYAVGEPPVSTTCTSTVASFIPGANIIVPAINAVNALSSGDIGGAGDLDDVSAAHAHEEAALAVLLQERV